MKNFLPYFNFKASHPTWNSQFLIDIDRTRDHCNTFSEFNFKLLVIVQKDFQFLHARKEKDTCCM
jgi:hypothetical protein